MSSVFLPPSATPSRKTIFLDLDETLIKSLSVEEYIKHPYLKKRAFRIEYRNPSAHRHGEPEKYEQYIVMRKGLKEFLQETAQHFEICVFTSAVREYAEAIVQQLDPSKSLFSHILSRENCSREDHKLVKRLSRIEGRDISQMVLLDDN